MESLPSPLHPSHICVPTKVDNVTFLLVIKIIITDVGWWGMLFIALLYYLGEDDKSNNLFYCISKVAVNVILALWCIQLWFCQFWLNYRCCRGCIWTCQLVDVIINPKNSPVSDCRQTVKFLRTGSMTSHYTVRWDLILGICCFLSSWIIDFSGVMPIMRPSVHLESKLDCFLRSVYLSLYMGVYD